MRKSKIIAVTLTFLALVVVFIGSSYALLVKSVTGTKNYTMTVGELNFEIQNETGNISLSNAYPMTDYQGQNLDPYTFQLTNTGTGAISYSLKLVQDTSDTTKTHLSPDKVKFQILQGVNKFGPNLLSSVDELYSGVIESGETLNFSLRIWLDLSATIEEEGKVFNAKVVVDATQYFEDASEVSALID